MNQGVGKTAIAEGLSLKELSKVMFHLNYVIKKYIYLDVASLVANTGIRGQFEARMQQLIAELQERDDIILFIDEIHLSSELVRQKDQWMQEIY